MVENAAAPTRPRPPTQRERKPPRLGFLGLGWIGRSRLEALHGSGVAHVAALADVDARAVDAAGESVGCEERCASLEELLRHDPDGVVIATPTALHSEQTRHVLERGVAVFCQKPLGRTAAECAALIELARAGDTLLGVDMSYRHVAASQAALEALRAGVIGSPHTAELMFHNAYGPDKPWVRNPALAGGGALIDLGTHLLDLAAMFLGPLEPTAVHADLFAQGRHLGPDPDEVEDLALAQVTLSGGRSLRLACSWWLPAGRDAVIEATFTGVGRSLTVRNVAGSFYDFEALVLEPRRSERLAAPGDQWGGRALIEWARRLAAGNGFDPGVEQLVEVAALIDRIYGR